MKTSFRNPFTSAPALKSLLSCAAITISASAFLNPAHGAALTWDSSADAGIQPGSGSWNTTGAPNWTPDSGTTNVDWSQTATDDGSNTATFAGADGAVNAYEITLASQMAVEGLTFSNTGYIISGSTLSLTIAPTIDNAPITVALGITATINSTLVAHNSGSKPLVTLNNGSVLNLGGGFNTGQFRFTGAGTLNITGGNAFGVGTVLQGLAQRVQPLATLPGAQPGQRCLGRVFLNIDPAANHQAIVAVKFVQPHIQPQSGPVGTGLFNPAFARQPPFIDRSAHDMIGQPQRFDRASKVYHGKSVQQ
jgi:hypothetical protein